MSQSGRQHGRGRYREASFDPARSETPRAYRTFLDGNREIHCSAARDGSAVRTGKAKSRTPVMHEQGKSDGCIVPEKSPNEAETKVEEAVEERRPAKGNTHQQNAPRTQCRKQGAPNELERVRQVAKKDKNAKFTALLHHVTKERLERAYQQTRREAAPGVDGVTWEQYVQDLERNIQELHARLHRGAYRARPSRRVYIPKPDGRQRPLGIAVLEDKIVQRAVVEVSNAIYEVNFAGFSYGFRPIEALGESASSSPVMAMPSVCGSRETGIRECIAR